MSTIGLKSDLYLLYRIEDSITLIVFSANYIDQSIVTFMRLKEG